MPDQSYLLLENRFRGSEREIRRRLGIYPQIFTESGAVDVDHPVLEIGAGRGELQHLLLDGGLRCYGVDLDPAMVSHARSNGTDVRHRDGLEELASIADGALGGVIAVQVVEHLSWDTLERLFSLCARKLRPGGRVVFETINPRSLLALSSNYFRDPTHVWPLHPDTLSYQMQLAGLRTLELRFLSPVDEETKLKEIPVEEYMSPKIIGLVEAVNRSFGKLNDLLYGYQDYCVIAEREREP